VLNRNDRPRGNDVSERFRKEVIWQLLECTCRSLQRQLMSRSSFEFAGSCNRVAKTPHKHSD